MAEAGRRGASGAGGGKAPALPELERQVGTMALSQIEGAGSLALMRAVAWHGVLARLGVAAPLVVIHDLGCLISGAGAPASVTRGIAEAELCEAWRLLLVELADAELVRSQAAWKHRDAMVGVVLARILTSVIPQLPEAVRVLRPIELPTDAANYLRIEPSTAFTRYDQEQALAWLAALGTNRLLPILAAWQLDVDALRLFGLFRGGPGDAGGVDLADLYSVMNSPELADVIDFSMELLPSILEVRRDKGMQAFSIDGYASVERRGNLDDLVLSQLALDEDVFEQKLVDDELFYFTHERQVENEQRTHHVLVDGSASMRGVREVFARGLALALCKRLALLGESVVLRFFDSRIYDGVKVGAQSHSEVPYVLQFRAERGRNYARVIRQLNAELATPRRAGKALIYLLTHGECQLPLEEVQLLRSRAPIYGVFILPRAGLDLPYLDELYRVHVIDREALSVGKRAQRAREIIRDVDAEHTLRRARAGGRR